MICDNEHCQCLNWVFKLSIASQLLTAFDSTNGTNQRIPDNLWFAAPTAEDVVSKISTDVMEAQDNLLQAKIFQKHYANSNCGDEFIYQVNNEVMLTTFNCHQEYHKEGNKHAAKFFPQWDGPYKVIKSHLESPHPE